MLTEAMLKRIQAIVDEFHTTVSASLKKDVDVAYLYGQLLGMSDDPNIHEMSLEQFRQHIKKNKIQLSPPEEAAKASAIVRAGQYITNFASSITTKVAALTERAGQTLRASIRGAVADNVAKRQSVAQLRTDLGHLSGDWERDWKRVAITEKQEAMNRGQIDSIAERSGMEARVFKRPAPDACPHCKRLHLEADGVTPRIFTLAELEGNGTNVGKKTADWEAVVGVTHPNCGCPLQQLPPFFGFDESGQMVPLASLETKKSMAHPTYVVKLDKALHPQVATAGAREAPLTDPGPSGANLITQAPLPNRQDAPSIMAEWMLEWLRDKTDEPVFYERKIEDYFVATPFVPEYPIDHPAAYKDADLEIQAGAEENKKAVLARMGKRYGTLENVSEINPQDPK